MRSLIYLHSREHSRKQLCRFVATFIKILMWLLLFISGGCLRRRDKHTQTRVKIKSCLILWLTSMSLYFFFWGIYDSVVHNMMRTGHTTNTVFGNQHLFVVIHLYLCFCCHVTTQTQTKTLILSSPLSSVNTPLFARYRFWQTEFKHYLISGLFPSK